MTVAPETGCSDLFATQAGSLDPFGTRVEDPGGPPPTRTTEEAAADSYATLGFVASMAPAHSTTATRGRSDRVGPTVPGYEIRGVLARGGMGIVYRALQTRANRMVALKMILGGDHVRSDHLDRFRIEAESVAALRHPNIIQVYEVGEVEGLPFFSLELLEGGTLADRLAGTPMPPRAAAELLATLARAIQEAHSADIIHRDLKPANILFDADGTPKVADFGLAKRLASEDGQTMTGQVMGTPAYMPPEQARGEIREVGTLADVYALGAVLYETLTGRPPFKGPSPAETLRMVVFEELVPPSRLQPKLPRDLETICLKSLSKEPSKRYPSAQAMAEDLDRYLYGKPIRARPTPAWERGVKWAKRRPATALSVAFGLAVVVSLAVLGEWYASKARNETRREESRVTSARLEAINDLDASNKEQARGDWIGARLTLSNLLTRLRDEPSMTDIRLRAERNLREVEQRLADDASRSANRDRLARFRVTRDELLFRDTQFSEASGVGTQKAARAIAEAAMSTIEGMDSQATRLLISASQQVEIDTECYLVLMVWSEATARPLPGEDPKAQAVRALGLLDRAANLREPTPAYHLRRASCLLRAGHPEASRVEREKANQLVPVGAFDHLLLGQEWARRGDWDQARRQFEEALRKQPDLFWAHCLLAISEMNSVPPRSAEARVELTTCLIQQPNYAWLYLLRGLSYGQLGKAIAGRGESYAAESEARFEDAEADFARALKLGIDGAIQYDLLVNRGIMRYQRRRFDAAAADFSRAIELDDRPYVAHLSMGQALGKLARHDEAIERIGLAIRREPNLAALYRERALVRLDRPDFGLIEAERSLRDLEESALREPPGARLAAGDHARRGRLLIRLDRPDDALHAADLALAIAPDLAEAHLVRIGALLDLARTGEVVESCNVVLSRGTSTADIHRLRGLGRAGQGDFAGAIEDYTQALATRPDWPQARSDRGWSYLFAGANDLALRDFEAVIRLAPADPDGLAGRAAARIKLGQTRDALLDAEASLKLGDPIRRTLYNAARTYAQAASLAIVDVPRRGRSALRDSRTYKTRATSLLRQAFERTPPEKREQWLREVVAADAALRDLRPGLTSSRGVNSPPASPD